MNEGLFQITENQGDGSSNLYTDNKSIPCPFLKCLYASNKFKHQIYANGMSLKEIQEWLGHSDISTTSNICTHLEFASKVASAKAIIGIYPISVQEVNGDF